MTGGVEEPQQEGEEVTTEKVMTAAELFKLRDKVELVEVG